MNKRMITVLMLGVMVLSLMLSACGNQGGATPDSAQAQAADFAHNPVYADDVPEFSVALKNNNTGDEHSVRCNYASDKENTASAYFPLPSGSYTVSVYQYDKKAGADILCTSTEYTTPSQNSGMTSVRIDYNTETKEVIVSERKSDRKE